MVPCFISWLGSGSVPVCFDVRYDDETLMYTDCAVQPWIARYAVVFLDKLLDRGKPGMGCFSQSDSMLSDIGLPN